jgi:glycosyltransferase involved in cell wall biosynthesis
MIHLPKISIVTPSFNQGMFLEKTILSVLEQGYPNLEYIIIDGGSSDNSVEIIKKYEKHLAYWESEPDQGQSHAINKGFERATGEIFGWLNSDDWYAIERWWMRTVILFLGYPNVKFH